MVQMREQLEGETVRRFIDTDVVTVPRDLNLQRSVDDLVFHHRLDYYPVVDQQGVCCSASSARGRRARSARTSGASSAWGT